MPGPEFAEPIERGIKGTEMVEFLRRRRASLDDVGSEHEQPSQVRLEGERKVGRTRAPNRSTVLRVTAEKRCEPLTRVESGLHPRHHRAAQRPCNIKWLGLASEAVGDREDMCAWNDVSYWRHEPKPEKASITE